MSSLLNNQVKIARNRLGNLQKRVEKVETSLINIWNRQD